MNPPQFQYEAPVRAGSEFARALRPYLLIIVLLVTACDKYEPRLPIEGTYHPNGQVHLEGRRARFFLWPNTIYITVSQPTRVSELGLMTYGGEVAQPGWKAEVGILELPEGGVYVVKERFYQTGRFEYNVREPTTGDWIRNNPFKATFFGLAALGLLATALVQWAAFDTRRARDRETREAVAAAHRQEELARAQQHQRDQQTFRQRLIDLGEQALGLFELLPTLLKEAGAYLDRAEVDFAEGAFAPFWDSVQKAATVLGRFEQGLRSLGETSTQYSELVRKYDSTPPPFPLAQSSIARLNVSSAASLRMQAIVRNAQRNFQFSVIYEQRKTNQILVAGFLNLGQALHDMSSRITSSLEALADRVELVGATFDHSIAALHDQVIEIGQDFSTAASEWAVREKKAVEMLDNIQRHRRPEFWEGPRP